MKTLIMVLLTIGAIQMCHAAELIEKSWFPSIDGRGVKAEYVDLNTNNTARLYIRYESLTDSGVELEKTTNNVVVWRTHVQPIEPPWHSKYCHEVSILIYDGKIQVTSAGGTSLGMEDGIIFAASKDAKLVIEEHSLDTGRLISRKVFDLPQRRH